jgi:hypothetical protein
LFARYEEKDPTIWFTQRRVGTQQSEPQEKQFGWDCMLGKLCRLAKGYRPAATRALETLVSECNFQSQNRWERC